MRSTFKILFYLKRDKQKANGMIPLYCRITVDGKETRFGMKCDVNPKYWDVKTGKATGRTADAVKINALVNNTKASIYRVYRELQERDNYVTAEKVKNVRWKRNWLITTCGLALGRLRDCLTFSVRKLR